MDLRATQKNGGHECVRRLHLVNALNSRVENSAWRETREPYKV